MSIFLSFLALIIFLLVGFCSIITFLFTDVKGRKWYQLIDKRAFEMAYEIDVMGNYLFRYFWNLTLSKGGYQFGKVGETISSALGKKQKQKSLTILGWVVLIIINIIDFTKWLEGGHCVASIKIDREIDEFFNR